MSYSTAQLTASNTPSHPHTSNTVATMAEPSPSIPSDGLSAPSEASSPAPNIEWLNHSQQSLNQSSPPDAENRSLARQKRRRTSPEDQKILEEEYQRNPKPDKAARMEIVQKVALGEKEVQIWFQNRRQNSRRKMRPLMAHEVIPHLRSSFADSEPNSSSQTIGAVDTDERSDKDNSEVDEEENEPSDITGPTVETSEPLATTMPQLKTDPVLFTMDTPLNTTTKSDASEDSQMTEQMISSQRTDHTVDTIPTATGSSQPPAASQETSAPYTQGMGYLANRRSASFRETNPEATAPLSASQPAAPANFEEQAPRTISRTRSSIRLSLTADGKAEVITNEETSPSPPAQQETPEAAPVDVQSRTGLQRSISAVGSNDRVYGIEADSPTQHLRRSLSGRSRDSRAWEFWCDSQSRNSLTEKAQQESSGSAADAIGLIRANSRGALRNNSNKRNAQLLTPSSSKRMKTDSERTPLMRSTSTLGRLQTKPSTPMKGSTKHKENADDGGFEIPQTESDKENWEPIQPSAPRPTIQHSRRTPRKILGESHSIPSESSSLGTLMAQEKHRKQGGRGANINPEDDEEIAMFMGGTASTGRNTGRSSVSSGEDLDCVQGLLKLSQGNWK